MRPRIYDTLPLIRQVYDTLDEIAEVINRSRVTVFRKLSNDSFTQREKELIVKDLIAREIETDVKEAIEKYFRK